MGLRLTVEGSENIRLGVTNIVDVIFSSDIPQDSNARSTDLGSTMMVKGKILAAVGGEEADDTSKLAKWALVPAESADCYRNVKAEVISADQIVRQVTFPNAFVIDYKEDFSDDTGIGTFTLLLKQKKDKMVNLAFEGGFSGE